jgi:hypothetical protein
LQEKFSNQAARLFLHFSVEVRCGHRVVFADVEMNAQSGKNVKTIGGY